MLDEGIGSLGLFTGEDHQPFLWPGGQPAALLIHGFMGTPAELRPLAQELHQAGWTVEGLLLPGFGAQIDTLFERRWPEWREAARAAWARLENGHRPRLLIGYSMGAAVALTVAEDDPPDGLILLAPFWRIGNALHRTVWQVAKRLLPRLQPFRQANFSDPRITEFFGGLMPDLNLGDPHVQAALRQLRVPARFVDQVLDVGRAAERAAAQVSVPTLIIQGTRDEAVRSAMSRQLLQLFPGPVRYEELDADHRLLLPDQPGYPQVTRTVQAFAEERASAIHPAEM